VRYNIRSSRVDGGGGVVDFLCFLLLVLLGFGVGVDVDDVVDVVVVTGGV